MASLFEKSFSTFTMDEQNDVVMGGDEQETPAEEMPVEETPAEEAPETGEEEAA